MTSIKDSRLIITVMALAGCVEAHQPSIQTPTAASGPPQAIATNVGMGTYPADLRSAAPAQSSEGLSRDDRGTITGIANTSNRPSRPSPSSRLSEGDKAAITAKIARCWSVDVASPSQSTISVYISRVNADGTIAPEAASIYDQGGNRAWALTALQAVRNPGCQPWPAPAGGWPMSEPFIIVLDPKNLF
jgi:hypothetical protein